MDLPITIAEAAAALREGKLTSKALTKGMPMGLQLAAPNLEDDALLQTSSWCENVIGRLPAPELKA